MLLCRPPRRARSLQIRLETIAIRGLHRGPGLVFSKHARTSRLIALSMTVLFTGILIIPSSALYQLLAAAVAIQVEAQDMSLQGPRRKEEVILTIRCNTRSALS